jgi:hypothetical protein
MIAFFFKMSVIGDEMGAPLFKMSVIRKHMNYY